MMMRGRKSEKVRRIFQQFDFNIDGGINRGVVYVLVVTVNPRVKISDEQINAILNEVFRMYEEFIDKEKDLTYEGLLYRYDNGASTNDRDFDALGLKIKTDNDNEDASCPALEEASTSSVLEMASSTIFNG
ncbi:hypothetical protein Lser_V15G15836 [Lactuca serriola]